MPYLLPVFIFISLLTGAISEKLWCEELNNFKRYFYTTETLYVVVLDKPKFSWELDFLYWFAKQEGNQYAITGYCLTTPGTKDPHTGGVAPKPRHGKMYELDFKMSPGYRVGTSLTLPQTDWEIGLDYIYLQSNAHGSTKSNRIDSDIIPSFSYSPHNSILNETTYITNYKAKAYVSGVNSNWGLVFNNINIELKTLFPCTEYLHIKPSCGFQINWHNQEFKTNYHVSSIDNRNTELGRSRVVFDQEFKSFGLRFGLEDKWICSRNFDILTGITVSTLWGKFKCKGKSYDTNTLDGHHNILINHQKNKMYSLSPVVSISAGLQYHKEFSSMFNLIIALSWENQVWFFQNQHSSSIADTSLILQGVVYKIRFEF